MFSPKFAKMYFHVKNKISRQNFEHAFCHQKAKLHLFHQNRKLHFPTQPQIHIPANCIFPLKWKKKHIFVKTTKMYFLVRVTKMHFQQNCKNTFSINTENYLFPTKTVKPFPAKPQNYVLSPKPQDHIFSPKSRKCIFQLKS